MKTTIKFFYYDQNDEEVEVEMQVEAKNEVCSRCDGEGKVVNPSIGAISQEQWEHEWSPEEQEGYLQGDYDVVCPKCNGNNVVPIIDHEAFKRADPVNYERWVQFEGDEAQYRAMERNEQRTLFLMGGGHLEDLDCYADD